MVERVGDADWSDGRLNVLACYQSEAVLLEFGASDAVSGRASLAFTAAAIKAALAGEVERRRRRTAERTSIALAGIHIRRISIICRARDQHRSSRRFPDALLRRHQDCPLHLASERASRDRDDHARTCRCTSSAQRIASCAGWASRRRGSLFPVSIRMPAKAACSAPKKSRSLRRRSRTAVAAGIDVTGPIGADTMFQLQGIDAFIVMLHDQGHIPAKLMAPNATAALTIGTPILFSSVAHGSAHDIAGKGIASPQAMIAALLRLAQTQRTSVLLQHLAEPLLDARAFGLDVIVVDRVDLDLAERRTAVRARRRRCARNRDAPAGTVPARRG